MATPVESQAGDNLSSSHMTRQPTRWLRNLVLWALLLVAGVLVWTWKSLSEQALVSAAYGARIGCVCRFVSQRPLEICEGKLEVAELGRTGHLLALSEDTERRTVTASVPLLTSQSATFTENTGCQLEPWEE